MKSPAIRLSLAVAAAAFSLGLAAASADARGEGGAQKAKMVAQSTPAHAVMDSTAGKPGDVQLTEVARGR